MTETIYFGGHTKRVSGSKHRSKANGKNAQSLFSQPLHHTHRSQFDPDPERDFLVYVCKVWVHEHDVPQTEQALAVVDFQEIQHNYEEFLRRGRRLPRRGSTLEELYLGVQLMRKAPMICLISSRQPPQPSVRILRKAILDPSFIVSTLVRGFESLTDKDLTFFARDPAKPGLQLRIREWAEAFSMLTYDGETGHAETCVGVDPITQSLVYYDPWPGRSLLAEGNNVAGVRAIPFLSQRGERLWLIKPAELERVLYAVVMPTKTWQDFSSMA